MIRLESQSAGKDLAGATITPISSLAKSSATCTSASTQNPKRAAHQPRFGTTKDGDFRTRRNFSLESNDRSNHIRLVDLDDQPSLSSLDSFNLLDNL